MISGGRKQGGDSMVILIVDDDPTNLFVLDEFLQSEGYNTITATNGAEAVEQFNLHTPNLILMDLSMPVMDGFEATRQIFAKVAAGEIVQPVILAVSANVTPEWRESCLKIGMEDFIEKPIDFEYLIPKISTLSSAMADNN